MSLTSCYRYILELPVNTLNLMLVAALSEDESAGIAITQRWENVLIDSSSGMTATVDSRPTDLDTDPPVLELLAADLALRLNRLRMRVEVKVNPPPDLDALVYNIVFDLPGIFEKDTGTPPKLLMKFPSVVTEPDLNLTIEGGDIVLTPALVEPRIHQIYDGDSTIGDSVQTGREWTKSDWTTTYVTVTTKFYDDDPGSLGFKGAITVEVPDATSIVVVMPGRLKIKDEDDTLVSPPIYINSDMTMRVKVAVETDRVVGEIRVRLSTVQSEDITVTGMSGNSFYVAEATIGIKNFGAQKFKAMGDYVVDIPTDTKVREMIVGRIREMARVLEIPIFTPAPPASSDQVDMTTFVPTTVNQQVLALQLEPLGDGTPCDTPDAFALADGFSIAISKGKVQEMIDAILEEEEGDQTIRDYDMTVESLTGTLSDPGTNEQVDGHIWIEGEVEVHVDCWFDPTIEFLGPVYLTPSMDSGGRIVFTAHAGNFGADDPCCGDVDPADIQALIEGEQSTPVTMPKNFTDVGELTLGVTNAVISSQGVVVHGTMLVTTNSQIHASAIRKTLFWFNDLAGGG